MTELEVKVKDGKITFPKKFLDFYPSEEKLYCWFQQDGYSKLLHSLGLSSQESDELECKSNQVVSVITEKQYVNALRSFKNILKEKKITRAELEIIQRHIGRDSVDMNLKSLNIEAPSKYTNFINGEWVCVLTETQNGCYAEIWEKFVWERLKTYLIEQKKLDAKNIKTIKFGTRSKRTTIEDIKKIGL